jgi:hypothetical protein
MRTPAMRTLNLRLAAMVLSAVPFAAGTAAESHAAADLILTFTQAASWISMSAI